ncbi:NTF2-like protein [Lasiosphaeris hirsuta]|uniref:mRNA export factor MEX67 n=1 Tax=Lasiosphaeris hirsuta TaxID=260670 RepID=A0AA40BA40_9PEZI|nr:NTF2-like protein [Lasiosphaeris hirsuta]
MAPPTGPRGGTHRYVPRGSRGGGISKRRATTKTDRDGDVAMDAPVSGGANGNSVRGGVTRGGRGSRSGRDSVTRPTRGSSRIAQSIRNYGTDPGRASKAGFGRVTLKVQGYRDNKAANNSDGGRRRLLEFIERKASRPDGSKPVTIGKTVVDDDFVWISVRKDDVPDVLRVSGHPYAGAPLTITETDEKMPNPEEARMSQSALELKQNMTAVLAKRYNAEQRLLDLSALGADNTLVGMGTFDSQSTAQKAFKVLMQIVGLQYKRPDEKKEALQAVSLARNDIIDVDQVFSLANALPDLKRLDLSSNKIETLSNLSKWRNRFKQLEELHLTGNPITALPNYVPELLQWFPSLQNLNGQQVRTVEEAAASLKALEPTPIPQFPSNLRDGDNNIAPQFLQAFFALFDTDRARLAVEFYDEDSLFSLAIIPNSGRNLPWRSYMKFSRNIHKFNSRNPQLLQRLFSGGSQIGDLWKALPATRHPSIEEPGQWLVDGHTFSHLADPSGQVESAMGLIIIVNGRFEEADASTNTFGTRTFTRTFVLGPSKPSNPPPRHVYRVISDQMTLHDWTASPPPATAPQPTVESQAPIPAIPIHPTISPISVPPPVVGAMVPDENMKAQLIRELSKRTGMTLEYSELCLTGVANWNFDSALRAFEEQKPNLPSTAFVSAV